jgi:LmbE family N-acetylglucosaminyl deacetylase
VARQTAIAIGAHPDDIEFYMAGTLLMLKRAGYDIHYFNVANGCCGSVQYNARQLARIRLAEAKRAAKVLGAHHHPPICNDMEVVYDLKLVRRVAAVIREVKPTVILTHPPADYMEDHTNTCRLVVTAAFAHAMPNFKSIPPRATADYDVTVYHSIPHTMREPLCRLVIPESFVNVETTLSIKRAALSEHHSQQDWLVASQGVNSFLAKAESDARLVGRGSKKFKFAEGWRRHLHYGFSATDVDPVRETLRKNYLVNKAYARSLTLGG